MRVATLCQEVPVQRPRVRRFDLAIGRCTRCRRRVPGRHPLHTSDALGAAAAQLGPQATACAVLLNKRYGLAYGTITTRLRERFGLTVTRGGVVHADTTVYAILPGHGLAQAASVIGHDDAGVVHRDGRHPYRYVTAAAH
jgi:hypothetical protein